MEYIDYIYGGSGFHLGGLFALAFMGHNDFYYCVVTLAVIIMGHCSFLYYESIVDVCIMGTLFLYSNMGSLYLSIMEEVWVPLL